MTRLRIGHGNGRNKMSLVDFAANNNFDSCGLNEAHRIRRPLDRIPDYRLSPGGDGYADRRALSSAIVTSDDWDNLGDLNFKVSDALPQWPRIAPDRFTVASLYSHPIATELGHEGIAHFVLHPDPMLQHRRNPDHPLVQEYAKALHNSRRMMTAARRMGLILIVTGDLQVPTLYDEPWGPKDLLCEPLDLKYWATKIDWLLYDSALQLARPPKVIPLFDHNGFSAVLEPAA